MKLSDDCSREYADGTRLRQLHHVCRMATSSTSKVDEDETASVRLVDVCLADEKKH